MKTLLIAALAAGLNPLAAMAAPDAPAAPAGAEQAQQFRESMAKEREARAAMMDAERKAIDAIRNDSSLTPAQKQAKIKPLRASYRAKIKAAHQKQLEQNKATREARRAAHKAAKP
jgi:hypothetical protein